MKHATLATALAAGLMAVAGCALAKSPQQAQPAPTAGEIEQHAMEHGPSTPRIGYKTRKDPPAPRRAAAPTDPRLLRPLTQREVGMLYHACTAYPECRTAYSRAVEHNDALLRARKAAPDSE